jgi:flagellum-specific ATP synthase
VRLAREARQALATYQRAHDLISIGAYTEGRDPEIDRARRLRAPLRAFASQGRDEAANLSESRAALARALGVAGEAA